MLRFCAVMATALAVQSAPAASEVVGIEFSDDIHVIRCRDSLGAAACELIYSGTADRMNCIAFGSGGEPLAASIHYAANALILFSDLDYRLVEDVRCRD